MKTYTYTKSRELFKRAVKCIPSGIPGHLGPGEGCMTPVDAFPFFLSKAQGAYIWDVDGNKFIDYMCAYGPNIMGYNDPDVDKAAIEQLAISNCTTLPSAKMVELAELMCDTVASADWTFFAKNGGDTTTFATMIAKEATNRKKMIFVNGFYHGVAPWCQKIDSPGVIPEDVNNAIYVDFNDVAGLEKVFADNKGEIAGFIATPYMHGNFVTNILPADGYWQKVRELCTQNGSILIIDDVRCGFRLDLAGSDHFYGFEADLICFCKAIANGYSVSALCGKDFLKSVAGGIMYTGSYWMSAMPFAAGIANINKLKQLDAPKYLREVGLKVTGGLQKAAQENGFNLEVSGEPNLFYLIIKNDNSLMLHQEWASECVKRGVWLTNHHNHFTNMAMTDKDIELTCDVANEAFKVVKANNPQINWTK